MKSTLFWGTATGQSAAAALRFVKLLFRRFLYDIAMPLIECVVSEPFMENSWIVADAASGRCVIVDPGFEPERIVELVRAKQWTPELILLTHGHSDHIAGNRHLKQVWPDVPLVIGVGDAPMLTDPAKNLSLMFGARITSPPADQLVREGDRFTAAELAFEVREIPGHSPGHVVYVAIDAEPPLVIGGDVLFQGSIGRTDFPGGNHAQLIDGIRRKLFVLPPETRVYPGHGDVTTVGVEREANPYCGTRAGLWDLA